jgi:hypothetical protein
MREAIGGSMLLYIIIPVSFLFVAFIAFIMNYASAYRASNYLVTQIETCDASDKCDHSSIQDMAENIRSKYHYTRQIDNNTFCYIKNNKGTVYRVTLWVAFDVPLIGNNLFGFPVRTESKTIYNVFNDSLFGQSISPCN